MTLNFPIVFLIAIFYFCTLKEYINKFIQKILIFLQDPIVLKWSIYIIGILIMFYFSIGEAYAMAPEGNKISYPVNLNISGNTVSGKYSDNNIPGNSIANGLTSIGVGIAIGGGMFAAASLVDNSLFPLTIKFGTIVAGGTVAGVLVTGINAINSIVQNKLNSSVIKNGGISGNNIINFNDPFSEKFCNDPSNEKFKTLSVESIYHIHDSVIDLLISNYYLQLITLYLIYYLIILFLLRTCASRIKNNCKFILIKKLFGEYYYALAIKILNCIGNINNIWIWLILILLLISSIGSLFFSFFILNNIDTISVIIQQYK